MEIIKFSAEWCGPCKAYKNIFDKVVSEYSNISVIEADVDKDASITVKYGIKSVPTTIIAKNDVVLDKITGLILERDLKSTIDKYISI